MRGYSKGVTFEICPRCKRSDGGLIYGSFSAPISCDVCSGKNPGFDREKFNEQVRASLDAWKTRQREPLYRRIAREIEQAMEVNSQIFGHEEAFERSCLLIRVTREQAIDAIAKVKQEESA